MFIIISGPAKNGLESSAGSPALQQNSSLNKYAGNDTFAVIYTFKNWNFLISCKLNKHKEKKLPELPLL